MRKLLEVEEFWSKEVLRMIDFLNIYDDTPTIVLGQMVEVLDYWEGGWISNRAI